jgi:hypothetical protein
VCAELTVARWQLWLFGSALLIDRARALGRRLPCISPPADALDLRLPAAKPADTLNEPLLPLHAAAPASESAHDASAAVEDDDVRAERVRIDAGTSRCGARPFARAQCSARPAARLGGGRRQAAAPRARC